MILVADGGSTKVAWRVINNDVEYKDVYTDGFNPYLNTVEQISEILWKDLQPFIDTSSIETIYYYGSGCSNASKNYIVEQALESVFQKARIHVDHDLMGAALSVCGNSEGIACILGTGSNSCYFDGKNIVDKIFSLGYFFGDEGSGAYLGKQLISDYLHDLTPEHISLILENEWKLSKEKVLESVYHNPTPNKFLGSFSRFLEQKRDDEYVKTLLENAFRLFFKYQVCIYEKHREVPVNFVGSVAFHFQDMLKSIASELGITTGSFIQAPIDGLVKYHIEQG